MNEARPDGGWTWPGPMSGTDTLFWRLSGNALTRPHVAWVWLLEGVPDRRMFARACQGAVARLPRLTHRVVESPLRTGSPSWVADPDFRVSRHMHHVRLPAPGGTRELMETVEWRVSAAFDPLHPPWEITLVEGYEGDRAAVVLKWHHSLGDAVTIVAAVRRLMDNGFPASSSQHPVSPADREPPGAGPADDSGVLSAVRALGTSARGLMWESARALAGPGRSAEGMRSTGRVAAQLLRSAAPSPLLSRRSPAVHCGMVTVSLPELKAAGKAAGASVTSAYVAAVLGAVHRYHDHHGVHRDSVPVLVPVSFRQTHETGAGNLIAGALIAGPIGDMPTRARVLAVHTAITEARDSVARGTYTMMAGLGALVPQLLYQHLAPPVLRRIDVVVTSVPGLAGTAQVAGTRVVNAVPWAPRGGAAVNVSMASHGDLCGVGTNIDPAAITAPGLFHRFLEESFAETLQCADETPARPCVQGQEPPAHGASLPHSDDK